MGCSCCAHRIALVVSHQDGSEITESEEKLLDELDNLYTKYTDSLKKLGVKHNL